MVSANSCLAWQFTHNKCRRPAQGFAAFSVLSAAWTRWDGRSSLCFSECLQVDEADYDARLAAYAQLSPSLWAGLQPWQAAPLVHACLADLRNPDDIALRHAAAQVSWSI